MKLTLCSFSIHVVFHHIAAVDDIVEHLISMSEPPTEHVFISPEGLKEWIPVCLDEVKPYVGMKFQSLDEAIEFYKQYALATGFTVRKSSSTTMRRSSVVRFQQLVCNREGVKAKNNAKTSRRRLVTRMGCNAKMVLKYCVADGSGYVVSIFHEGHSHTLCKESHSKFEKEGRKLSIFQKKAIVDNYKVNVGPSKTYRLFKEHVGGYENVRALKQDFKNFHRDVKALISDADAEMFVSYFLNKKERWSAYFFEYEVDNDGALCNAFWADPICIKNYAIFGDTVSFDTTFKTNKYNLVFGPFTGIDNHKCCITFAACLIAKEDVRSFEWVFKMFLKAMRSKEPTCLITDQDPAMGIAIKNIFKDTQHRFCMWHIMRKMSEKIGRLFFFIY